MQVYLVVAREGISSRTILHAGVAQREARSYSQRHVHVCHLQAPPHLISEADFQIVRAAVQEVAPQVKA